MSSIATSQLNTRENRPSLGYFGIHIAEQTTSDCMCSVKCAETMWNYKSGRHSAL